MYLTKISIVTNFRIRDKEDRRGDEIRGSDRRLGLLTNANQ